RTLARPPPLRARPAFGLPRAGLAEPFAGFAVQRGEHAEALHRPRAGHLQELAPGGAAGHLAADVAGGFLVAHQLAVAVEVRGLGDAEDEAVGLDGWIGHGSHFCGHWLALIRPF